MSWAHAPLHFTTTDGVYIVTAGTYLKRHFYRDAEDLSQLEALLFAIAKEHRMFLHAWCLLVNHYHMVISAGADTLPSFLRHLHSKAAIELNRAQRRPGRKVWYQYYDTLITSETSYFARLKYVHENAVHHGVVAKATNYRWCSATWFADHAPKGFVRAVENAPLEGVVVRDDY